MYLGGANMETSWEIMRAPAAMSLLKTWGQRQVMDRYQYEYQQAYMNINLNQRYFL